MSQSMNLNELDVTFIQELEKVSGQRLSCCYQCGKCTAGCPIACSVEFPPHKIIRMAQLGLKKQVLSSPTIWLCLSCVTCTARCPKDVDLANVMDSLRELAIKEGFADSKRQKIRLFEELFLDSIRAHGRLFEMGTLIRFNLLSMRPFQDVEFLLPLFIKNKLGFRPKAIKDKSKLEQIFKKYSSGGN